MAVLLEGLLVVVPPGDEVPLGDKDPPAAVEVPVLRGVVAELVMVTLPPWPTQLLLELFKTVMGATQVVRYTRRNVNSFQYTQEYPKVPAESRIWRVR